MNEWVPAPPPLPPAPSDPLPPANSWNPTSGCTPGPSQPAITDSILITGVPATITAVFGNNYVWSITLNDGSSPANFTIDRYDASGVLIDHPLELSGVDGSATFNDQVFMQAASATSLQITLGPLVLPGIAQLIIPGGPIGSYLGSAGTNGVLTWFQPPAPIIPTDAPSDGQIYARQSVPAGQPPGWVPISTASGDFLPLTGGTMTGPINFDSANGLNRFVAGTTSGAYRWVMNLGDAAQETGANAGSNFSLMSFNDAGSAVVSTPLTIARSSGAITVGVTPGVAPLTLNGAAGTWRSIAGSTNGSMRWQMYLGNPTGELGSNFGSNFQLNAYSDAGVLLFSPLQIARATGVATFSSIPSFPGGTANQVLSTNGSGTLSWMSLTPFPEAPTDGQQYARQNAAWAPIVIPPSGIPEAPTDGQSYLRRGSDASWQLPPPPGSSVTVGDVPPASPKNGDLWFDSVGGQTYVWYVDPSTSQWVIAVNASGGPVVQIGALPPGNPSVGQLYWDSVGAQLYVYYNDGNSSQWVPTSNQLGGGYLQKAGVTDGSDAPAGQIGEVISSNVSANVPLTSAVGANVTSIVLTAGDWDVTGEVWITPTAAATGMYGSITTTSATTTGGSSLAASRSALTAALPSGSTNTLSLRPCRASLTAPTTYYLVAQINGAAGNGTGNIWARRAR